MSHNSEVKISSPDLITLEALEARRLKGEKFDLDDICYEGIRWDNKSTLEYIHDKFGYKFTGQTFQLIMTSGSANLELIKYIRSAGWEWDGEAVEFSTIRLPILKWLIENGCPHDPHRVVMSSIVWKFGNPEALKYLHEELGYEINERHLNAAQSFKRDTAEYIAAALAKK